RWSDDGIPLVSWLINHITPFIANRVAVIITDHVIRIRKNRAAASIIFQIIAAKHADGLFHIHLQCIRQSADFVPDTGCKYADGLCYLIGIYEEMPVFFGSPLFSAVNQNG